MGKGRLPGLPRCFINNLVLTAESGLQFGRHLLERETANTLSPNVGLWPSGALLGRFFTQNHYRNRTQRLLPRRAAWVAATVVLAVFVMLLSPGSPNCLVRGTWGLLESRRDD